MSVEEDTELRDLVSQTLENNGVLAKIRAELRASVFLAVEEQESHLSKAPFANNALKEYLSTPHGILGLCLVREFLEYLELDFTISVFNSETRFGKDYQYEGRCKLLKDLQIKNINGKKGPLLAHILHIAQQCSEAHSSFIDLKEGSLGSLKKKSENTSADESNLNSNCVVNHKDHLDTSNVSLSPLDRTYTTESSSVKRVSHVVDSTDSVETEKLKQTSHHAKQLPSNSEPQHRLQLQSDSGSKYISGGTEFTSDNVKSGKASGKDSIKGGEINSFLEESGGANEKNSKSSSLARRSQETNNPMTSLNNLPPLDGIQTKREVKSNNTKFSVDDLDSHGNYEEDFLSTESSAVVDENSKSVSRSLLSSTKPLKIGNENAGSQRTDDSEKDISEKRTESPSICEEIDPDTNSEVDDLLNSTSGENTIEATISHVASNLADYCESL